MNLFNTIFGFDLFGAQRDMSAEHNAYISQLNAMLEKQKRDAEIEKRFAEKIKEQEAKLKGRILEGEFEVIDTNRKQLKGDVNA